MNRNLAETYNGVNLVNVSEKEFIGLLNKNVFYDDDEMASIDSFINEIMSFFELSVVTLYKKNRVEVIKKNLYYKPKFQYDVKKVEMNLLCNANELSELMTSDDENEISWKSFLHDDEKNEFAVKFKVFICNYQGDNYYIECLSTNTKSYDDNIKAIKEIKIYSLILSNYIQGISWKNSLNNSYKKLDVILNQLSETQKQLIQSDKMAVIGQLAAGIAHEINNPIGYIQSNVNTLADYINIMKEICCLYKKLKDTISGELTEEQQNILNEIKDIEEDEDLDYILEDSVSLNKETAEGIVNIKNIVNDLKTFSKVGKSEEEFVNLNENIDTTLKVLANELKYNCKIIKEYNELPEFQCLSGKINQVFLNLIVNASHAIKGKGDGVITISTNYCEDERKIFIKIKDNGIGMSKENQEKIFQPFFTTKETGTGLGMPISYNIIEEHGGKIEVESELGVGTCFTVVLPVDDDVKEDSLIQQ